MPAQRLRVLFLNRSYGPDTEATGQLLAELCEDLAARFEVMVIAGQPNDRPECAAPRRGGEVHGGVAVRRVCHTRFSKGSMAGRVANYLTFLFGASCAAVRMMLRQPPDVVVVETDPPLLCLIGWLIHRLRRARLVVYLQDIHPDIGVALGKVRDGWLVRALRWLIFCTYRGADRVVVLSRDMRQRVVESGVDPQHVVCIPNWVDTRTVRPAKHGNAFRRRQGINGEFVVMYSGNLGLCQRLEDLLAAASHLRDRPDILFLLVGGGVCREPLLRQVDELGLRSVRFLACQPKAELRQSLSAAEVHLVPLDPRVASCLMPSKLYGVLASGTPLIAVAPEHCELAQLTRQHRVGFVVQPGQPESLARVIRNLADEPWALAEMGRRARRLAVAEYDRRLVTRRFAALLDEIGRPGAETTGAIDVQSLQEEEAVSRPRDAVVT